MPDIDTIIAKWKASFEFRTRYEGQEPREDELLVAEVERLRRTVASHELDLGNAVQRIDRLREINDALRESAAMDAAEVERLRAVEAKLAGLLVEASMHMEPEWDNEHDVDVSNRVAAAANLYEPHPTEPGLYRRKETRP